MPDWKDAFAVSAVPFVFWVIGYCVVYRPTRDSETAKCGLFGGVIVLLTAVAESQTAFRPKEILSAILLGLLAFAVSYAASKQSEIQGKGFWWPGASLTRFMIEGIGAVLAMLFVTSRLIGKEMKIGSALHAGIPSMSYLDTQLDWALCEEVFYRGFIFLSLINLMRKWRGRAVTSAILSSLIFAAQHISSTGQEARYAQIFFVGLCLCYIFNRYGLLRAGLVHTVFNCMCWYFV